MRLCAAPVKTSHVNLLCAVSTQSLLLKKKVPAQLHTHLHTQIRCVPPDSSGETECLGQSSDILARGIPGQFQEDGKPREAALKQGCSRPSTKAGQSSI